MSVWIETDPLYNSSPPELVKDYFNDRYIYMNELYVDCVIELYSHSTNKGYDYVAIVYNKKDEKFIHFKYADQDSYLPNNAFVDAPKEIFTLYEAEINKRRKQYLQDLLNTKKSYKGMRFKVTKGKKPTPGTRGFCFWSGMSKWGRMRLGLKSKDGETHWVDLKNCEVDN